MLLQLQGFEAKSAVTNYVTIGVLGYECQFEKFSHCLLILSCRHALNVKGLVWQSESQGYNWFKDTHTTLVLLFLLSPWLCIACGRSLPQ